MEPPIDVDINDLDDDEALRYAIELSLREQDSTSTSSPKTDKAIINEAQKESHDAEQSQTSLGGLMLDRKKMEAERLARHAKRNHSSYNDDVVEIPPPKRQALSSEGVRPSPQPAMKLAFPTGVVKRTWARGYPRAGDDVKIEEVLQKEHLQLAVLSSFQWDEEWLLSKVDLKKTKLLLVAFAADETQVQIHQG